MKKKKKLYSDVIYETIRGDETWQSGLLCRAAHLLSSSTKQPDVSTNTGDFNQLNYYPFWKTAYQLRLSTHVCLRRRRKTSPADAIMLLLKCGDISEKVVLTCRSCREGNRRGEITNLKSFIKSCGIQAWGVLHKQIYWMQKWLEAVR